MRIELTTSTLARLRSTAELRPHQLAYAANGQSAYVANGA